MNSLTTWRAPVSAACAGALLGGVAIQILMPLVRWIDPFGLTPIVLLLCLGAMAIAWYLRTRRPSADALVAANGEL